MDFKRYRINKILNNNVFFVAENTSVTCFDNEIDI